MKNIIRAVILCVLSFITGCNKYSGLKPNEQLRGYVYVEDTLTIPFQSKLGGVKIYLGETSDTLNYLFQTKSDTAGHFNIPFMSGKTQYLFTRFFKNNTEYTGVQTVNTNGATVQNLVVKPIAKNGLLITFRDSIGGAISNLPFRLYSSRLMAEADSFNFAYASGKTDLNGRYGRYNFPVTTYYVVSKQNVSGKQLKVFQSFLTTASGIKVVDAVLK